MVNDWLDIKPATGHHSSHVLFPSIDLEECGNVPLPNRRCHPVSVTEAHVERQNHGIHLCGCKNCHAECSSHMGDGQPRATSPFEYVAVVCERWDTS